MAIGYREFDPPRELKPFVECAWTVEGASEPESHRVLPDGCSDLIHTPDAGVIFVGPMTRPMTSPLFPGDRFQGIRFRPGGAKALLGETVPLPETVDRIVPVDELPGLEVQEFGHREREPGRVLEALFASLQKRGGEQTGFRAAIRFLERHHGRVDLNQLAFDAGLSPRQFRRRCLEETGLAPKQLSRVLRFREAVRCARNLPCRNGAQVAAECGYYDQAHLIRDFQEFAGETPAGFFIALR